MVKPVSFIKGLELDVRPFMKKVQGCDYINWMTASAKAGLPAGLGKVVFKTPRGDSPIRQLFGGAVTAVDVQRGSGRVQRVYLPVLNNKGAPVKYEDVHARDVNDTQARCISRAIAICYGVGLSLYTRCNGNGPELVQALGVRPDTPDLSKVSELREIKEIKDKKTQRVIRSQEYLGWYTALAAATITDPDFHWEIEEYEVLDPATGALERMPAMRGMAKGWMVGVTIRWKERVHTELLPIMGIEMVSTNNGMKPMEHQAIDNPNAMDWHSAVMRCLAKAIALVTGYGIELYAKHDAMGLDLGMGEDRDAPGEQREGEETSEAAASTATPPSQPEQAPTPVAADPNEPPLVREIRTLMAKTTTEEPRFLAWLGIESFQAAPESKLEYAKNALLRKAAEHGISIH